MECYCFIQLFLGDTFEDIVIFSEEVLIVSNNYEENTYLIDLAGQWDFQLDPEDTGFKSKWYMGELANKGFCLPGTTNENKQGEPLKMDPVLAKETVKCLRQKYRYVGAVWYQRSIKIPLEWNEKRIVIFLERVMYQSILWIDGNEVGQQDSLSTPHVYDISDYVVPGREHNLTIMIDNRDIHKIGPHPSAYTDETQTIWNGIVGRMNIYATDKVFLSDVQIYPDIINRKVFLKTKIENYTNLDLEYTLTVNVKSICDNNTHRIEPAIFKINNKDAGILQFEYQMGEHLLLWDEFSPNLYEMELLLSGAGGQQIISDRKNVVFGMKEFKASGTQFTVNGRKTFLRGTLDCCIYPLTGYPPMEAEDWHKIFKTVKEYGLNHIRFHSWCPPEAAFKAADEIGIYLQIEGPVWMDTWTNYTIGCYPEHYSYLPAEARRIISTYGNHPSFCMFSNGNELNGDFNLLHDIISMLKEEDGRFVYTLTSNWDRAADEADDFFVAQSVDTVGIRGQYYLDKMAETTELDYENGAALRNIPIVSHEVGQYCVYPNMNEISKYKGVLRPINLEAIYNDLENMNMLKYSENFMRGSGMLALQLYKDEIEAALRTNGFAGFQLLDIHDFPGQSTATVGILDSFWESKGLVEPEKFRQFCSPTVPLLRMHKRIYLNDETFEADLEFAHFGSDDIKSSTIYWSIKDEQGKELFSDKTGGVSIPVGSGIKVYSIRGISLNSVKKASKLTIVAGIQDANVTNSWDIWVYPVQEYIDADKIKESDILFANTITEEVKEKLKHGGNVLLCPEASLLNTVYPGKFFPVFWSPVHFTSKDPCGIYCDNSHAVFNDFPTDFYSSYQWKDLLENSVSVCLDSMPEGYEPIIQVIPNFFNNHKISNLFEAKAGNGKLLVCSMDIESELEKRPAARQLRQSILKYMGSSCFEPSQELTVEQIGSLFNTDKKINTDLRHNLALKKPAVSDSEKSTGYSALKGNDGNIYSRWCANDAHAGHWWQVDLGEIYAITGSRVVFEEEGNYLYVIQVSDDGQNWRLAVNQTGQTSSARIREDSFSEKARYVKIVYNGLPDGGWAGHCEFDVYGE